MWASDNSDVEDNKDDRNEEIETMRDRERDLSYAPIGFA